MVAGDTGALRLSDLFYTRPLRPNHSLSQQPEHRADERRNQQ
jgi:hypothetical protein